MDRDENRAQVAGTLPCPTPAPEPDEGAHGELVAQNKRRQLVERMRKLKESDAYAIEMSWK
jgi:hypothetical protein